MKLKYTLVFLFGFLVCFSLFYVFGYFSNGSAYSDFAKLGVEIPFGTGLIGLDNVVAPADRVPEDSIIVFEDKIILKIPNATISNYADSGSMNPLLDKGANGIRVVPENEDQVDVGDIVSYRLGKILVVHRVVEKGVEDKGIYVVTRGDNNLVSDGKIRFEDIEYVTIGIIY